MTSTGASTSLFFGILVLDEQLRQVGVLQSDLSLSLASVEAMVKGGTANQTDVDVVKVEQVKARQRRRNLLTQRNTYLKMLSTFVGKEIGDGDTLVKPMPPVLQNGANSRPEHSLRRSGASARCQAEVSQRGFAP